MRFLILFRSLSGHCWVISIPDLANIIMHPSDGIMRSACTHIFAGQTRPTLSLILSVSLSRGTLSRDDF